jgi:hypothetical protein
MVLSFRTLHSLTVVSMAILTSQISKVRFGSKIQTSQKTMTVARLLSSHHSFMNGFRLFDLQNAVVISGDTALGVGSSYASDVVSDRFFNNIPPGAMQQQAEKMAVNQISGEASESVGDRMLGSVTDSKFRAGMKGGAIADAVASGVFFNL